jgi:hypothetical protein
MYVLRTVRRGKAKHLRIVQIKEICCTDVVRMSKLTQRV